jgi:hemin uptake protein HemP
MMHAASGDGQPAAPKRTTSAKPKVITSSELMGGRKELIILHAEGEYLLRITSNGKLILTK